MVVFSIRKRIAWFWFTFAFSCAHKTRILSLERPTVDYINPKYCSFANATARRFHRDDPVYYVSIHVTTLQKFDDNISIGLYLYEYSGYNRYHRSFIDFNFRFCKLLDEDKFIGAPLRRGLGRSCPFNAGDYHINNVTISQKSIPEYVPIRKGRLCLNLFITATKEPVANGCIDLEIREVNVKN